MSFYRVGIMFLVSVIATLSGCASNMSTQSLAEMKRMAADELRVVIDFCSQRATQPEIAPLKGRIVLWAPTERPTIAMLNDERKAGPEEQKAILALDESVIACANKMNELYRRYSEQERAAVGREIFAKGQANRADLYMGKISFGEYNRKTQENLSDSVRRNAEITTRKQSLQAQQAAAAAAQDAADAASDSANMQRAMILRDAFAPRPLSTSCIRNGNFVNCSSY